TSAVVRGFADMLDHRLASGIPLHAHRGRDLALASSFIVSAHNAVDARARAEQKCANLGRRPPSGTQQQDMQSQQAAASGMAQLSQHPFLLMRGNLQYGRTTHSKTSAVFRWCGNSRNTKDVLTVPFSCYLV